MQTGNSSGPWSGRFEFFNPGTQPPLPNSSSSFHRAYSSYQGSYNGSLQGHGGSSYLPQPRLPNSLSPYVQHVDTLPDNRDFVSPARIPIRPPSSMPHNNLATFHGPGEARVIALEKNIGAAEPLQVTQTQWEENKAEIKRMYLEMNKSLDETMIHMKGLGFVASSKLYKEKLKEWKFLKNLSGETAYWVLNHAQERKSVGKSTHYTFGQRELPIEQAQKSAARYIQRYKLPPSTSAAAPQTPGEITYTTPSTCAASPYYASSAAAATPSYLDKDNNVEEELWYPRFTYDGNSKSYYDELVSKAEQFSRLGQHAEALRNYLEALAGYRNLLSPTHDLIISSVYKVAQLHMQLHDSKAADRILESATEAHVSEHGLWGERTVQHISQLIKMLQGWARQNEALPLVLHMLQGQEHGSYTNLSSSTISINFDATGIQRHLAMADMLGPVMDETTKAGLVAIAQRCEAQPLDFPQQTLDVWLALIRAYKDAEEDGNVQDALDRAASSVSALSGLEDPAWTMPLFFSLLALLEILFAYGKHEFVDGVLLVMEERAEYTLNDSPDNMVDLFLRMGMLYQKEDMWEEADHYFQHAQAASAKAFGRMDTRTRTIEDARRQQHYEPKLLSVRRVRV